jgi:hypothetical protein
MSIDIGAKAVVVCSISGMTARMVSRFRAPADILGLTTNARTWRRLALSWGVLPVMCDTYDSTEVLFYTGQAPGGRRAGPAAGRQRGHHRRHHQRQVRQHQSRSRSRPWNKE